MYKLILRFFRFNMANGSLTFIGLGLYDEKDISLKGLEEIKNCDKVFAEFYTAKLTGADTKKIEKTIEKLRQVRLTPYLQVIHAMSTWGGLPLF